jgi:hypothetical protein
MADEAIPFGASVSDLHIFIEQNKCRRQRFGEVPLECPESLEQNAVPATSIRAAARIIGRPGRAPNHVGLAAKPHSPSASSSFSSFVLRR